MPMPGCVGEEGDISRSGATRRTKARHSMFAVVCRSVTWIVGNLGEARRLVRRHRDCSWTATPYEQRTDDCEREFDST